MSIGAGRPPQEGRPASSLRAEHRRRGQLPARRARRRGRSKPAQPLPDNLLIRTAAPCRDLVSSQSLPSDDLVVPTGLVLVHLSLLQSQLQSMCGTPAARRWGRPGQDALLAACEVRLPDRAARRRSGGAGFTLAGDGSGQRHSPAAECDGWRSRRRSREVNAPSRLTVRSRKSQAEWTERDGRRGDPSRQVMTESTRNPSGAARPPAGSRPRRNRVPVSVLGLFTYRPGSDEWTWSDGMYRIHGFERTRWCRPPTWC